MYDIVGIDMPCMDLNVNTEHFPSPGRGELVKQLTWQGGGKVASGMIACARLGAKCAIMGCVGDDRFGKSIVMDFERHGINTSALVVRKTETTSLSIVLSDYETRNRTFIFHPGSASRDYAYGVADMDITLLQKAKYLFICSANQATEQAVDIARAAGTQVFIDADGYSEGIVAMIPKIDVFVGSENFYAGLFDNAEYEENCRKIMAMGPRIVVFTFGEQGCLGVSAEGFFRISAYDVAVADTVGAGDVFHGAFLAGLLNSDTVEETARFASAVAAIKCTRIGGRAGIPDRPTTERFMRDGVIDYSELDARVAFYQRGLDYV